MDVHLGMVADHRPWQPLSEYDIPEVHMGR